MEGIDPIVLVVGAGGLVLLIGRVVPFFFLEVNAPLFDAQIEKLAAEKPGTEIFVLPVGQAEDLEKENLRFIQKPFGNDNIIGFVRKICEEKRRKEKRTEGS